MTPARLVIASLLLALAAATYGCGDNGGDLSGATTTPAVLSPSPTPLPVNTVAPAAGAQADEQEVTGIVGAVIAAEGTIEINQLSGADVSEIAVSPATRMRRATGGALTLAQIRPSDRIIARGTVEGGVLAATTITVQDVVPGAQPGG